MPTLEVIDKGSITEKHQAPMLFVHGGKHAAWCWDEHFLDFFAAKGYRALAVSLRGHGGSDKPASPWSCSISSYVDDVCSVADHLPVPPVVVGHSLGGFVVQKYLEIRPAPAAVLMAPAPPAGAGAGMVRDARAQLRRTVMRGISAAKVSVGGKPLSGIGELDVIGSSFFSPRTPQALIAQYAERLQDEKIGRFALDMVGLNLPKPERITTPILLVGGQYDGCVTAAEVLDTARTYCAPAEFFPEMGHDMMLEPGWNAVAERIDTWLSG